ncbi:helix-turn-helix domain-containing protein [Xanthomonas albilineans]|nr:transcriptional regulator [Xanthomonas albilineans]
MYHYTESGLRNVWLRNGFTVHKTPYGDGVAIEDVDGLHKALALALTMKPRKLSSTEIRFLRKEMQMSQIALAAALDVNVQTLATWEKAKAKISGPADRMLRVLLKGHFNNNVHVRRLIETLNSLDQEHHEQMMIFQEEGRRWKQTV